MNNSEKPSSKTPESAYSGIDRALHNMVFGSTMFQEILSDLESGLFSSSWEKVTIRKPIFVTSLPRAGTTIVLELLNRFNGIATHTYRDMPLIFTPVLWNRLSSKIRKKAVLRERAHGDGMIISEDSPEAFEEALWLKYFPKKYLNQTISLWHKTDDNFTTYFREHIKKIISLRYPDEPLGRYVSKNNANITRIDTIHSMFTDAIVLIPLRDPVTHAFSLLRQHKNFLQQHVEEPFVRKYMSDIGHFEFGELHRPIQFPELNSLVSNYHHETYNYWLAYWVAAYDYLASKDNVIFLSFEKLCESPESYIRILCQKLDIEVTAKELSSTAKIIKSPAAKTNIDKSIFDQQLLEQANTVYSQLLARSI